MRAQLTVFIILGILIIVAFSVVFYASSLVSNQASMPKSLQTQPVRDYVASCLERTAKDAFVLAGRQAGRIFVEQGGVFLTQEGVEVDGMFVPYAVVPPEGRVAFYDSHPPVYPFEGFPYIDGEDGVVLDGFFGFNRMPALHKRSPEGLLVNQSIQLTIETYIENALPACANWSSFDFDIAAGEPNVSLVMARNASDLPNEQFVSVLLEWPIQAMAGPSTKLSSFAVRIPVRVSSLYFFAKGIIDGDVSNAGFVPRAKQSFDVEVIQVGDDDVVRVTDSLSVVDGVPFELWFARKNRPPPLWYVDVQDLIVHEGTAVKIDDGALVFDDACDDEVYVFGLNATDPDEDDVTFHIDVPDDFETDPGAYTLRLFASDGSSHEFPSLWEDYQDIDVRVVACV